MSGIRTISGSLAKPLGTTLDEAKASDSATYSRLIGFQLTQEKSETMLTAILKCYKNGEINIAFDTDFDTRFDDEKIIPIISAFETKLIDCEKGISIQLTYPDTISRQTINNIRWVPFTCIGLKVNDSDTMYSQYAGAVYSKELLYGVSPLINDSLCIIIQNKMFDLGYSNWSTPQFAILPKSSFANALRIRIKYKNVGDTILLNNSFFTTSMYNGHGQTVMLEKLSNNSTFGNDVGFYVDSSLLYKNINGDLASLVPSDKKLTLLEFWGTWCGPCIQLYPALDSLLTAFERQIQYQGVAFDKQKDLVKKYVNAKPQIRNQIFVEINQQDSNAKNLVDIFKVSNFPSFMLIDQSGKILLRETGIDGFQNLKQYLLNQKR